MNHERPVEAARLIDARKTYRIGREEVRALDGVSFTVYRGDYVAIMGTSGSGKSSLLNVLGTLDALDAGTYELDGRRIDTLDDDERSRVRSEKLGFVFQAFHLLPRLTALENVAVPLRYAGVLRKERAARAAAALARVGLESRAHHRPSELSGGQQQRVALARALVNRPSLLLADEPTGALDSGTTNEVLELFDSLNAQGVTLVVVTHDESVGRRAARIVGMEDGRIRHVEERPRAASTGEEAA